MFKTTICRICLRTDIETRDDVDEELVNFHDEISDYSVFFRQGLEYCSICEHLLRKFFTFYKKCRLANEILQCYKKNRKTHIQDRRYKCSLCQKGFLHSCALRCHVRYVHHQERRVRKPRDAPRIASDDQSSKPPTEQ